MPSRRDIICQVVSLTGAALCALTTLYLSIRYLAAPHDILDWAVQICAAMVVAIIIYFLVWGHFQQPSTSSKSTMNTTSMHTTESKA
ncbi:MAG: hypothetical protein HKL96_01465 [Phycisphaerales bacterium]|nr:hypothetical protein [Phycisphaerales bacterium]